MNAGIARFVLTQAGMQVACAPDAHAALAQVRSFAPDLVLMDMPLPMVDGMALTRQLRAQPAVRPMSIVAFTAYAMVGDKERFLAAGCNGYIAKPIQAATFADELRAFLPSA